MIWAALGLAIVGLSLSGLFSGSETGFYRASRIRLVLDALSGDRIARGLLWLTNHASMFVATTLVGNNLANYLVSLAIVLAADKLVAGDSWIAELIAPVLLAPILFVYGELVPKYLFLHAPNRLLRRAGWPLLVFVVLFLPISSLLWLLNRALAGLLGESPERVHLRIARRELRGILEEGHEAGILHPVQQKLAASIFASADHTLRRYLAPLSGVARARAGMSKEEVLGLARRFKLAEVPIEDADQPGQLAAYVRTIDLELSPSSEVEPVRPLMSIPAGETPVTALIRLHSAREHLARVVDNRGQTIGILSASQLRQRLLRDN